MGGGGHGGITYKGVTIHQPKRWHSVTGKGMCAMMWFWILYRAKQDGPVVLLFVVGLSDFIGFSCRAGDILGMAMMTIPVAMGISFGHPYKLLKDKTYYALPGNLAQMVFGLVVVC
ncbi:hypothetical protein AG4045_001599 [Apium graveolens]|uniref:Uncharacterized protein n=1 Tax=Apium graveolens TaxID=4045 RepID=A0A6L5BCI5_APIGR|nr:hypothetical protein AG4045_001599 [Apium graveolens]